MHKLQFHQQYEIKSRFNPMSLLYNKENMMDPSKSSHSTPSTDKKNERKAKIVAKKRISRKDKKKQSRITSKGLLVDKFKSSLWKLSENVAYMEYLQNNEQLFYTSKIQRKNIKINVQIAIAVKTRSPDQCRSHHQKMIKYHKDIPSIIIHIQSLLKKKKEGKKVPVLVSTEERTLKSSETNPLEVQDPFIEEILAPQFDLDPWMLCNQFLDDQRFIDLLLDGVQAIYGRPR